MKEIIISAIQQRLVLAFRCHGHNRVVEPHLLGVTTAGHLALRAFQSGGTSSSGEVPDWREFLLTDISQIASTGARFSMPRFGYKPGDKGMTAILAKI